MVGPQRVLHHPIAYRLHARMGELVDQFGEQRGVEPCRIEGHDGLAVALLPVLDHAAVEALPPRDAALEETESQLREAARDAAEEQRLGERLATFCEAADLVVLVPSGPEWNVGATLSSMHLRHTGS